MPENPTITPTSLQRAVNAFLLDREAGRCSPATLRWYEAYLTPLVDWLRAHEVTHFRDITTPLLRAYVVDVQSRGLAPKGVHHHASAARAFCNFLVDEGLLAEADNPARRLKMPKLPKTVLPALDVGEVEVLLDHCDCDRDRAVILFLLDSGLRAAECAALDVGDVDLRTGCVQVHHGKGDKARTAYIGARTRKALTKYLLSREDAAPSAPLWHARVGERLTDWGLRQMLQRVGERAGVHAHPHKLRRSFAIWALRSGMDIVRLAQLLGHADLQVVRKYLALVESDLADAHRAHGPVDSQLPTRRGRGRSKR